VVLLAAFAEVVAAWSREPRFCINVTLFNRLPLHPEVGKLVGDFTSLTLLEVDLSADEPFAERARRLQQQLWEDLDHPLHGGVQVLRDLRRARGDGAPVLMPVVFTSTLPLVPDAEAAPMLGELVDGVGQTPQVWLDHQVTERDGALSFWWDAVDEAFPGGLLDAMFAAHDRRLAALALAEAWTERAPPSWLQVPEAGPAAAAAATGESLWSLFAAQAGRRPLASAVVGADWTLTYAELARRAESVARRVREAGAGSGHLVMVLMDKGCEQVVAALGVLRAGAAYLPVDPALPDERIQYLAADGNVAILLTQPWLEARVEAAALAGVRRRLVVQGEPDLEATPLGEIPEPAPDDLAYVIYTSGSTGQPKGVAMEHGAVVNTILDVNSRFSVGPEDRTLLLSSLSFDLSVYDIFGVLAAGGAVVIPDRALEREPAHWAEMVRAHGVTLWNTVPALMLMLVERLEARSERLPLSMRLVLLSGDWIPVSLPERVERLGERIRVVSLGGATEAGIWSIQYPIDRRVPSWTSIPYGTALAGQRVDVRDARLERRPPWAIGELYIAGASLARGYWHDEAKTSAAFVRHPRTGDRLYRTGDLGFALPDRVIVLVGRDDLQCKVRGYRVELGEIDAVLTRHPRVAAAAVCAHDGPGGKRLVAYVVPADAGQALERDDLVRFLAATLPDFMIPSAFVEIAALPLTANGKVDRGALPAPDAEAGGRQGSAAWLIADVVARIYCDVLGREAVDMRTSFFEVGGDSLLAARFVAALQAAVGVELSLRAFFETPTIEHVAQLVEEARARTAGNAAPIKAAPREAPVPLSTAQRRLWLLGQVRPSHPLLNIAGGLRLRGPLDVAALASALDNIVRRHDVLRATVEVVGGQPAMRLHAARPLELPVAHLDAPTDLREASLTATALEDARRPFDLARGPLFRARLLRLGEDDHALLLGLHHLVADAWSLGILIHELLDGYAALAAGRAPTLPPLPVQYADYAVWERRQLEAPELGERRERRTRALARVRPLELPTDRPRGPLPSFDGDVHPINLPPELGRALARAHARDGVTTFMVLLAALNIVLQRSSGQADVVVGTSIASRGRPELELLIGCFVNLLVVPCAPGQASTFGELCRHVRDAALDAYDHRDIPHEQVVDGLRRGRPDPLLRVMLVLQNAPTVALTLPGLGVTPVEVETGVSRYELHLHFAEADDGALVGAARYDTSLFDRATVADIASAYQAVLRRIAAEPNVPLGALRELLRAHDQSLASARRAAHDREDAELLVRGRRPATDSELHIARRAPVRLHRNDLVESAALAGGTPASVLARATGVSLADWIHGDVALVREHIRARGAVLFRGFHVDGAGALEAILGALSSRVYDYVNRSTPRTRVLGHVYTSTEYPPQEVIPLHNELSYSSSWPAMLVFYCACPAERGGATLLADSHLVYTSIPPSVRERFERRGILYARSYGDNLDLPWEEVFQTRDPAEVEAYCRTIGMRFTWKEGGRLGTQHVRPAVVPHPDSGLPLWFNQAHLFHVSSLRPAVREALLASMAETELPRNAYHGDGDPIDPIDLAAIRAAYSQHQIALRWEAGDVAIIDNMRLAHGREAFEGERRLFVAMADSSSATPP
jgi:amino acid adenylation domain-containing protein